MEAAEQRNKGNSRTRRKEINGKRLSGKKG